MRCPFRRVVAILALVSALSGCALVTEGVDRPAYYAARDTIAAASSPQDAPAPPFLDDVPGLPVTDDESAGQVILARAGQPADPVLLTAARFMARMVADPERMCGPVPGDPMADLMTAEIGRLWQAELVEQDSSPYVIFDDCELPGLPIRMEDIRISSASLLRAGPRPQYLGDGVGVEVEVIYLVRRNGTVTPVAHSREAFVYVQTTAPYRISGFTSVEWTTGPGLGAAGLPDPDLFAGTGDESAVEVGEPDAVAAVSVLQALARTLASDAAELSFRRDIGWVDEESTRYEATGSMYPRTGGADLSGDTDELLAVRVIDQNLMFTQQVDEDEPDAPAAWTRHDPEPGPPDNAERANPLNVFALLDWIGHLGSAAATPCSELVIGESCFVASVPTGQALTPGTPGYPDACLHAASGNSSIVLQVAVTDRRLAAIGMDYTYATVGARSFRSATTWEIGRYDDDAVAAQLRAPPAYGEE